MLQIKMKTIIEKQSARACARAAEIIKSGGLVAFPTETVYGLGSSMDEAAVKNIFRVKGRDEGKPLSVLVSSADDIKQVAELDERLLGIIKRAEERFWPGPLTLILPKKEGVSDIITAGAKTIGVRMPDCDFALELIRKTGTPVVATSANLSGKPAATTAGEVLDILDGKIDMVVTGADCPVGCASTVAALAADGFEVLREGPISIEQLREILYPAVQAENKKFMLLKRKEQK